MAVQTNGNKGADEAKAEQADGNKNNGSFWHRSPEWLASFGFGSDGRRSMSGSHFVDNETIAVASVIVLGLAGALLFAAGFVVGKQRHGARIAIKNRKFLPRSRRLEPR